jgi:type VI secretion system secreted protein VgrG
MSITQTGRLLVLKTPLKFDELMIQGLRASEGLSRLFHFQLDIIHDHGSTVGDEPKIIDIQRVLGQPMTVSVEQKDGTKRFFNGICARFEQGNRIERFTHYRAVLLPRVWLLTQNIQSRIFQHVSVPDILKKVFEGFEVDYEIQGTFEPRNYCVQYRESDFDFASRLMEEEGIYYYFEHKDGSHRMIIANTPQSHRECPGRAKLPFRLILGEDEEWIPSIQSWRVDHQLRTGMVTLWDHSFELPHSNLQAEQLSRFNIGGNQNLEHYDYPGIYAQRFDGIDKMGGEQPDKLQKVFEDRQRVAEIRQQEIDVDYKTSQGTSDSCALIAGYRFEMTDHPVPENNCFHVLVDVETEAVQLPSYVSDEFVPDPYKVRFKSIPHGAGQAPFRPERKTPKPVIHGTQTAYVVGPAGEEIFTDKYGRVKVQFHWDRDGQNDAGSSCWLRVAQSWAGKRWGTMFIPRVGMEVMVAFLEGDPDRPIIVGCVYNAEAMPPYELPDEKTKMTIKSDSTKGGGGFNELRFEDKKGSEQIFIHGEKDLDMRIKNDAREWVGNDHHFTVKRDRREKIERDEQRIVERDQIQEIKRDEHLKIGGKSAVEVTGSVSRKVGSSVSEKIGGSHTEETTGTIYLKSNSTVVIEGTGGITLKVGGNFITINPGGIFIQGTMVMINSGGAALSASPVPLVPPLKPAVADPADDDKPGSKIKLEKRSAARKERTFKPLPASGTGDGDDDQQKEKKSFIKIVLKDEAGNPVPGERYKITLPDGSVASGSLDENGQAEITGIDPGSCKITFPDLDKEAWE